MEPAATIRQLRLDVHTASLALGRELPERLSQLFHGPLLAVLTDELSRVAGSPRRLAELVLVLPPIAAGRLAEDLPAALRLALRRALTDLKASEAAGMPAEAEEPWAGDEPQTRAVALGENAEPLAGLRHFLLTGRLPWQVSGPGFDLDAAVARAGRQHPRALLALLRQVGPQPWPRQRLARQLAPATLDQLIGLLAPADAPLVRAYLYDTLAAHRRRPLLPAAAPALRQVLHELVLADLLAHWHTQFNRRAFVARQLRQLAAHYSIDLAALLRQLVAALPLAGPPQPQSPTLPGLVHELHHQLAGRAGWPATGTEPDVPAEPAAPTSHATPGPPATPDAAVAPDAAGTPVASATPAAFAKPTAPRPPATPAEPAISVAPTPLAAALAYYLRHGSLPPVSGEALPQATLAAEATRVLGLGRGALLALARQAGPTATANGLLALLPSAQHAELVRRLAPGHTRPVLALLDELARPAAAAARRQLWQRAVAQLLAAPPEMALPTLRRWLPLQVPALLAAEASHGAARAQLFHYLLAGLAPLPGVGVPSPAQLRRTLRELLADRDRSLPDFLSEYRGRPLVLRHLAALAGAALLTQLVPGPTRPRPRHAATQRALAALLGEPARLAAGASGAARQQLLREAYLLFYLRGPDGAKADSIDRLRQLPQAYGLPTQALRGYLRHQVRQCPVLASSGFFKWLVAGLSAEGSPQAGQSATTSPAPLTADAPYSATENVAAPTRQTEARPNFQVAAASYSATKFDLAGKHSTQPNAPNKELMARGRIFGRLNYAAVLRGATARGATTQAASANLPAPVTGDLSGQAATQLSHATPVPTTESPFGQGAEVDPDTGIEQRATTGPAAAPAPQLVEALGLHLAWPATTAEALRTLAFYHPARRNWRGELRPLLHWLAARAPTPVAAWLSAHLLAAPRWPGPAALLDFPLLGRLLAGARAARPALAALEMQASQELARSPQLLALLRAAALLGHFEPAGAGRQLVRLAAAYSLPRRATAARLSQLVHQWPVLATLPGWHLLRAELPTPAPWAAALLSPSTTPKIATSAKPMTSATSFLSPSAGSISPGFVPAGRGFSVPLPTPTLAGTQAGQSPAPAQRPGALPPDTFPVRTHFLARATSAASAAEGAFSAASLVGREVGAGAPASPNLLFYYLLHGRAPWWHTGPLLPAALGQALRRAAQPPQPLREFLRRYGRQAAVQRHLAALTDFSLLHELLPPGAGRSRRQLVRPALAALDRSLRRPAGASQERLRLFLQEAYLAYASSPPAPADPLAAARRQAAASGLAWRTVLARAAALLHQHPALAADPFFAALLHATLARPAAARRPKHSAATTQSASISQCSAAPSDSSISHVATTTGSPALPRSQPGKAAFSAAAEETWVVVARYLQAGAAADNPAQLMAGLPPRQAADVLARARPYVGAATGRQRLAALLRPAVAEHLLRQWWPTSYRPLGQVARGWLRLPGLGPDERAGVWAAVLAVALAGGPRPQQLAALLTHLLRAHQPTAQTAQQVLKELTRRGQRRHGPLAALLAAHAGAPAPGRPLKPASHPAPGAPASRPAGTGPALAPGTAPGAGRPGSLQLRPEAAEAGPAVTAYVANAGLVLLWPFMTMLFERLGYLEQRQFKSPELAERATHLLQFLATGEENFPEYELVLNKLLCGVEAARPLTRRVPLTPEERSTGEGLLGAVLQRWEVLKNTSVAGLRETFLQRAGRLDYHAERVALTVETKTLDILLDQRPWSISTIKLPWMPLPLYVTWR
jgi:hypothetical protein